MRPSLTLTIAALAGAAGAMEVGPVELHGFASQGYLYTTNNNFMGPTTQGGTFEFNEFALNATAQPHERVRVGLQIMAYDLADTGNDQVQIDWAYGTYRHPLAAGVDVALTAGRFKTGHGLYGDYRDIDVARSAVFLPITTYSPRYRDYYIAVNGASVALSAQGRMGSIEAMGYVGTNQTDVDGTAGRQFAAFIPGLEVDSMRSKRVDGGHVNWSTPLDGLRLHGGVMHINHFLVDGHLTTPVSPPGGGAGRLATTTVHFDLQDYWDGIAGLEYQAGNFTFAAEGSQIYFSIEPTMGGMPAGKVYNRWTNGYLLTAWRFHRLFEISSSYGVFLSDDSDTGTDDPEHRGASIALRFDPIDHWLIKAEFQRNRGTALLNSFDNPNGYPSRWWNMVAIKTTYDF
jgi:hypothetical protein